MTITMDINTLWAVLGVGAILAGALTEVWRTRTPRTWWYDLDKRLALVEQKLETPVPKHGESS